MFDGYDIIELAAPFNNREGRDVDNPVEAVLCGGLYGLLTM
jgi:hypothetical protein